MEKKWFFSLYQGQKCQSCVICRDDAGFMELEGRWIVVIFFFIVSAQNDEEY